MIIRPMRTSDVSGCAAIMHASPLWARYGITTLEAARRVVNDMLTRTGLGFVAEDAGGLVGFVVYAVEGTFVHSGYVQSVAVAPDAQRRGIGGRLMEAAEAAILGRGPNVFLLVSAHNTGAQRFYERRGYRRIGEIPDYVRRGITECLYRKTLRPIEGGEE